MATPTEYIKLTGNRLRETEKAVHFRVDQVGEAVLEESVTHWFPLSQIQKSTTRPTDGEDELFVADWIWRAKEFGVMAAIDAFIIGACIGSIATFCFIWFGVALVRKWYD